MDSGQTPRPLACSVRAAVFLNGEYDLPADFFKINREYTTFDFFCADGGANIAVKIGIVPLLVMGDMDSITIQTRRRLENVCQFIELPADKNFSDGEALLKMLKEQGYTDIHIFAATGGRLDQTMFNLQLLQKFPQARIITQEEEICFVDKSVSIRGKAGCRASLIATTATVGGLTLEGFKYNLLNSSIESGSTLTLSNVIISGSAKVSYQSGGLLLVVARNAPPPEKTRHGLHLVK
ncbi:MAG: thiamine diphosphokinase [Candidatus Riflebacteria bacterium HGW-Riflebacteria-1]|jgi:thiamine pyrophosphokinase|nr:MAG: thiamine diphosphokinase [Candidatus Riflebacteria bacterium HGW-Riflebacteria-1]